MTRFRVEPTSIAGVQVIKRKQLSDERGYLERLYDLVELNAVMPGLTIQQVNRTFTRLAGTVRGLHLQLPPNHEVKIVSCLKGRVFDVAVDLRKDSSTYLRWFGCELAGREQNSLLIPPGCAHGVQTLTMDCELLYFHTSQFAPESEAGLNPLSARVDIKWPVTITALSERDQNEVSEPLIFEGVTW